MIDMLARIKATYDKREISEGEILRVYETVPLLIIDDMGKEPPTDWGVSKIYTIINARYEGYKPTIVTSNYTDTELEKRLTPQNGDDMTARATVDRREKCARRSSWRARAGAADKEVDNECNKQRKHQKAARLLPDTDLDDRDISRRFPSEGGDRGAGTGSR